MDKSERRQFFEDWLRAYSDHLHLVRQGPRIDLVCPDTAKPPVSTAKMADASVPKRKSSN